MKNLFFFISVAFSTFAAHPQQLEVALSTTNDTRVSLIKEGLLVASCKLGEAPDAVGKRYDNVRLSFDQLAIIFSDLLYLPVSELTLCENKPLYPKEAAPKSGMLGDINVTTGIYVSLELVGVRPLSFLAIAAQIGKTKNLINLDGAYSSNLSAGAKLKKSFSYSTGTYSKISLNGRYISANGEIDCSSEAFPGVWDIIKHRKVIFHDAASIVKNKCNSLFVN